VDPMRLIYTGITRFSLQDFCPYFVPHCSMSLFGVVMNMDTWESLSKDAQDLITECGLEMEEYSFENMPAYEQENLDILSEACEVYELTPDDIAAFQTALEPYYETIIKDCEEKGYLDQANKFLEIAKAVD